MNDIINLICVGYILKKWSGMASGSLMRNLRIESQVGGLTGIFSKILVPTVH